MLFRRHKKTLPPPPIPTPDSATISSLSRRQVDRISLSWRSTAHTEAYHAAREAWAAPHGGPYEQQTQDLMAAADAPGRDAYASTETRDIPYPVISAARWYLLASQSTTLSAEDKALLMGPWEAGFAARRRGRQH